MNYYSFNLDYHARREFVTNLLNSSYKCAVRPDARFLKDIFYRTRAT